jgi:hypothetical protein
VGTSARGWRRDATRKKSRNALRDRTKFWRTTNVAREASSAFRKTPRSRPRGEGGDGPARANSARARVMVPSASASERYNACARGRMQGGEPSVRRRGG